MESWLRDIVRCPVCHGQLTGPVDQSASNLTCAACAVAYPIIDGIPVLLSGEAIDLDGADG